MLTQEMKLKYYYKNVEDLTEKVHQLEKQMKVLRLAMYMKTRPTDILETIEEKNEWIAL